MAQKQAFFKAVGGGLERALVPDVRSKILATLGLAGTGGAGISGYSKGKEKGLLEGKTKTLEEVRKHLADVLLGSQLTKANGGLPKKASFMEKPAAQFLRNLLRTGAKNSQFARTLAQTPLGAVGSIGRRFTSMNPGAGMSDFGFSMRDVANNAIRDLKGGKSFSSILDDISSGVKPLVNQEGKAILSRRLAAANRLAKRRGFDSAEGMAQFYYKNPSLAGGSKNISKRLEKAVTSPAEKAQREAQQAAANVPGKLGFGQGLAIGGGVGLPLAGGAYWLGSSKGYDKGYSKGGDEGLQAGLNFGHYLARQQVAQNNEGFLSRLGNLFTGNVSNFATPDFSGLTFADYLKQRNAQ